jgi:hypothetical protein
MRSTERFSSLCSQSAAVHRSYSALSRRPRQRCRVGRALGPSSPYCRLDLPTFGRPVRLRASPHRLRPGSSPHAFRIPSRDGHPALRITNFILRPARHYPRFWIWPSSSECQKDFNLPEQRFAQHTLCPLLTPITGSSEAISRSSVLIPRPIGRSPEVSSIAFHAQPLDLH